MTAFAGAIGRAGARHERGFPPPADGRHRRGGDHRRLRLDCRRGDLDGGRSKDPPLLRASQELRAQRRAIDLGAPQVDLVDPPACW